MSNLLKKHLGGVADAIAKGEAQVKTDSDGGVILDSKNGVTIQNISVGQNQRERIRKGLTNIYAEEEKVSITISPTYAPFLGRVVTQSINGISVSVPCDGNAYMISKSFADHIQAKLKHINKQVIAQGLLNNVEFKDDRIEPKVRLG